MAARHDGQMTSMARQSTKAALVALIVISIAGTADVGEFLATRTAMFGSAPGRATGAVAGLVLWTALLGAATARYARGERPWARSATVALAALVATGSVGLTAVHLVAGVRGLRPFVGGGLGILALILAFASEDRSQR